MQANNARWDAPDANSPQGLLKVFVSTNAFDAQLRLDAQNVQECLRRCAGLRSVGAAVPPCLNVLTNSGDNLNCMSFALGLKGYAQIGAVDRATFNEETYFRNIPVLSTNLKMNSSCPDVYHWPKFNGENVDFHWALEVSEGVVECGGCAGDFRLWRSIKDLHNDCLTRINEVGDRKYTGCIRTKLIVPNSTILDVSSGEKMGYETGGLGSTL